MAVPLPLAVDVIVPDIVLVPVVTAEAFAVDVWPTIVGPPSVVEGTGVIEAVDRSVVVVSFDSVATVSRMPPIGPVGGAEEEVALAAAEAYADCEVALLLRGLEEVYRIGEFERA